MGNEKQMQVLTIHLLERQRQFNQVTVATDGLLSVKSLILRDIVTLLKFPESLPRSEYETHAALQNWFTGFLLPLFICVIVFFFVRVCTRMIWIGTRLCWVRPYEQTPCFLAVPCVAWRSRCSVRLWAARQQHQRGPAVAATLQVHGMLTGNATNP